MKKIVLITFLGTCWNHTISQTNFYANSYLIVDKAIDKKNATYTPIEVHLTKKENSFTITVSKIPFDSDTTNDTQRFYEFDNNPIEYFVKSKIYTITSVKKVPSDQLRKILGDLSKFYHPTQIIITGNGLANFTSSSPNAFTTGATAGFGLSVNNFNGKELGIIGTVSQTKDTINSQNTRDFGTSILVPGIRKFSLMLNFRNRKAIDHNKWGYGFFINITPINWQTNTAKSTNSNIPDSLPINTTVVPLTFEGYFSYTWFNNVNDYPVPNNPVVVTIDMGITFKSLGGDQLNKIDRQAFLGSPQKLFPGLLLGIDLRFAGSHAYFYSTLIPPLGKNSTAVNGLTGIQIVGGIGLAANIAKL